MYAVICTGGKQYRVSEGDVVFIEKLDAEVDATVNFDQVLAVGKDDGVVVGAPTVAGATVTGKVLRNGKAKKITVFTYRPQAGPPPAVYEGRNPVDQGLIVERKAEVF